MEQFQLSPTLVFAIAFLIILTALIVFAFSNQKIRTYVLDLFPYKSSGKNPLKTLSFWISVVTIIFVIVVLYVILHLN